MLNFPLKSMGSSNPNPSLALQIKIAIFEHSPFNGNLSFSKTGLSLHHEKKWQSLSLLPAEGSGQRPPQQCLCCEHLRNCLMAFFLQELIRASWVLICHFLQVSSLQLGLSGAAERQPWVPWSQRMLFVLQVALTLMVQWAEHCSFKMRKQEELLC